MSTYNELMAQAQALMRQAEQARKIELGAVIEDIKSKIKQFNITAADLGLSDTKKGSPKIKAAPKYRGPNGEPWSGGPGRKPAWVRLALEQGKDLEAFKI